MLKLPFQARVRIFRELNNGNNGQTKHWSGSHKERQAWRRAVDTCEVETADGQVMSLFEFKETHLPHLNNAKVGLIITRVLGPRQRLWDPDSILRGNAKQLIDTLVEADIMEDDNAGVVEFVLPLQCDKWKKTLERGYTLVDFYAEVRI